MEKVFIRRSGQKRLILIFLGWGMDGTPFSGLEKAGYDILALYDYSGTPSGNGYDGELSGMLREYSEIVVIAWSFGVRMADDFLRHCGRSLPVTLAIAVNGTTAHIDDKLGIPKTIFAGTLANLSAATVRKFERRMFGSAADFNSYALTPSHRTFESRLTELNRFAGIIPSDPSPMWSRAVIGLRDAIFPPQNQREAWKDIPADMIENLAHFPDLQTIINRYVIDKELVARRFTDALPTYTSGATVQARVARHLWDMLATHIGRLPSEPHVLEIGVGRGLLTRLYVPYLANADICMWDIADIGTEGIPSSAGFRRCDAETAIRELPDGCYDLVLSSSTLQWFNSPSGFLKEVCRVLRPGGIAAISLYGDGTYREIADVTGESLKYPVMRHLAAAITENTTMLLCAEKTETELFDSPADLLRNMKQTGVNALGRPSGERTRQGLRLLRRYPLTPEGKAPLTYRPLYFVFKKI